MHTLHAYMIVCRSDTYMPYMHACMHALHTRAHTCIHTRYEAYMRNCMTHLTCIAYTRMCKLQTHPHYKFHTHTSPTYMHICMHASCVAYMHASMHAYMHAYMHTHIHAYVHACVHIYMYILHACIVYTQTRSTYIGYIFTSIRYIEQCMNTYIT